jgi:nitrate/TMAO reductase-like tetraheme cytochrome c subunit
VSGWAGSLKTTATAGALTSVWALAIAVSFSAVHPVTVAAQKTSKAVKAPENDTCLLCHGDPAAVTDKNRHIGLDAAKFGASIHGGFSCVQCHTDLATTADFPHPEKLKPVDCGSCHADAVTAYNRSIHAAARRLTTSSQAPACADCHSAHEIRPATDPASRTYPLNLPETCARCHGDANVIKQGNIRIGNVAALYKDSIHGQAISKSGLLVAANCTSCHDHHDIRQKTDPEGRVYRATIPSTCGTCHAGVKATFDQSAHGEALAKKNPKAPVCSDCHTAHSIQRTDVSSWKLDVIKECGTCHADKISTYRDTFHGQVTSLGFVRVATCSDCHTPHNVHPKSDARSTVSSAHVLQTCQQCHPTATAGFAKYDPHADKNDKSNPVLYYSARFMKWLLIGTFGFFGLHSVLWFGRSVGGRRKRS